MIWWPRQWRDRFGYVLVYTDIVMLLWIIWL